MQPYHLQGKLFMFSCQASNSMGFALSLETTRFSVNKRCYCKVKTLDSLSDKVYIEGRTLTTE